MQESSTGKRESDKAITIEEDLSLGQLALFMPFSSNVYVAVRTKDESRDGQQTHEWTTEPRLTGYNYVLDLGYYNLKTKDLLRYMQPNIVSAHFSWLCGCRRSSIMNRRIWSREGYSTLWDSRTITLPLRIMHLLCLAYTDDCVDCLTNIIINMFLFESSKEKEVRLAT